jgi:hypothetical protein
MKLNLLKLFLQISAAEIVFLQAEKMGLYWF